MFSVDSCAAVGFIAQIYNDLLIVALTKLIIGIASESYAIAIGWRRCK